MAAIQKIKMYLMEEATQTKIFSKTTIPIHTRCFAQLSKFY